MCFKVVFFFFVSFQGDLGSFQGGLVFFKVVQGRFG